MRAFLSHSSKDKSIVEKVWTRLGSELSWLDKAEIEFGDVLLEKIVGGIEESTDFILFWSKNSAIAPWVRYELNMAVIKSIEQKGFKIRVVKLDDTDLPLYLKPMLFLDATNNLENLPEELLKKIKEGKKEKVKRKQFVNRSTELGLIEEANDNFETAIITLFGIYGIGKKALIRRSNEFLYSGGKIVGIQVKPGFDLVALALELSFNAKVKIKEKFDDNEDVKQHLIYLIEKLHSDGNLLAFYDVQHWLTEDGELGEELEFIFSTVKERKAFFNRPIFLTTTRYFNLNIEFNKINSFIRLDRVSDKHMVTIINNCLEEQQGITQNKEKLIKITQMVYGYPFAGKLVAGLITKYGTDYLIDYPNNIVDLRIDIAKHLIGQVDIDPDVVKLLETIALVDGPLPLEDISNALDFSEVQIRRNIEKASEAGLIFYEDGILSIHPLVQDYYYRSVSNTIYYNELKVKLAGIAKKRLQSIQPGTPLHSKLLPCVFRLVALAGSYSEAVELRADLVGYLGQVVKDLYDSREYKLACDYSKFILEDNPDNWIIKLYYARSLIRLDDMNTAKKVLEEMLQDKPKDVPTLHALGRMEMGRNHWKDALKWFSKAITIRSTHSPSIRDSAECYFQLNELKEAEGFVKRAKEIDSTNAYILQVESKIYERKEDYDSAYKIMKLALMQDRNNPSFHHRMGRISELRKDYTNAKKHYIKAIENDNKFYESQLSLLNLQIDLEEYDGIKGKIEELEGRLTGRKKEVLNNVKAKYLLSCEKNYEEATKLVESNIRRGNNSHSYHIRARIELDKAKKQIEDGYSKLAQQSYSIALSYVEKGLMIFKNDTMLLDIKNEIESFIPQLV